MARARHLPSSLAWGLAVLIAYLERRNPDRGVVEEETVEPAEPRSTSTPESGGVSAGADGTAPDEASGDSQPLDRGAEHVGTVVETSVAENGAPPKQPVEPSERLSGSTPDMDASMSQPEAVDVPKSSSEAVAVSATAVSTSLRASDANSLEEAPTAAAADPLIDAEPGETVVGPDAPIRLSGGERPVPSGAVVGDGSATCPDHHPIKGNASSRIYHQPGQPSYERTIAEYCFATEQDAENAGYRPPKR